MILIPQWAIDSSCLSVSALKDPLLLNSICVENETGLIKVYISHKTWNDFIK